MLWQAAAGRPATAAVRSRKNLRTDIHMSCAIDGFAPSTDSTAPSIAPSMAQQSVDRTAIRQWCCAIDRSDFVLIQEQSFVPGTAAVVRI